MSYSVVIPVRDDVLIHRAIRSVPAGAEIVVGLSDAPQSFVAALAAEYGDRIKLAPVGTKGMAAGINIAVLHATHENIIVLDSDCIIGSEETIPAYLEALETADFVRGITLVERKDYWSKIAAKGTESLNEKFRKKTRFFGPSIAFKRSSFLKYGGYDTNMVHGSCDHEFSLRIEKGNEPIRFVSNAVIIHKPLAFKTDTSSHFGYGLGMRYMDKKYKNLYGLGICLERINPVVLCAKLYKRGLVSVFRSVLLGIIMLAGYASFKKAE